MRSNCPKPTVTPGACPPEGCPPFDRIECIVVEKVYDSCFQVDQRTRDIIVTTDAAGSFPTGPFAVGDIVECGLTEGLDISCTEISRTPTTEPGFYTVSLVISVPVTLTNPNAVTETVDTVFTFTKAVTLCAPEGTQINCEESSLLLCSCVITSVDEGVSITVTCDIQICVVLKSTLVVQLLVPSYGFCIPAPCVTIPGVCPPSPPEQCY
jgi:hypothetical protein